MAKKTKTVTKGSQIITMLRKGWNNDKILAKVDTTLNSVQWYRSKVNKGVFS